MLLFKCFFNSITFYQMNLLKQMNDSILYDVKCFCMKSKWIYLKQFLTYLHLFPSSSMLVKHNIPRKQYNEPSKQTYFKSFMDLQKDFFLLFTLTMIISFSISEFMINIKKMRYNMFSLNFNLSLILFYLKVDHSSKFSYLQYLNFNFQYSLILNFFIIYEFHLIRSSLW